MVNLNDKVIDWKYLVTFQTQNIEGKYPLQSSPPPPPTPPPQHPKKKKKKEVIKIMKSIIKLL